MKISTILLVDNDLDDRDLFAGAVSRVSPDITLYCATDGVAALEELAANAFTNVQLILLDVNMPRMDGWEMLRRIKCDRAYHHIPVIMLSTSSGQKEIDRAIASGAVAYISKPADFEHLVRLVRVIVALPEENVADIVKNYSRGDISALTHQ